MPADEDDEPRVRGAGRSPPETEGQANSLSQPPQVQVKAEEEDPDPEEFHQATQEEEEESHAPASPPRHAAEAQQLATPPSPPSPPQHAAAEAQSPHTPAGNAAEPREPRSSPKKRLQYLANKRELSPSGNTRQLFARVTAASTSRRIVQHVCRPRRVSYVLHIDIRGPPLPRGLSTNLKRSVKNAKERLECQLHKTLYTAADTYLGCGGLGGRDIRTRHVHFGDDNYELMSSSDEQPAMTNDDILNLLYDTLSQSVVFETAPADMTFHVYVTVVRYNGPAGMTEELYRLDLPCDGGS